MVNEHEAPEEQARRLCRENYAEQMDAQGYNADGNPKMVNRHGIPDQRTVPPMPQRAETPERPLPWKEETPKKGMMQIETINIENDTSKIEKQLEGIKKELHTLNEILKHWSRR